jgi:ATP adenylyltransferase
MGLKTRSCCFCDGVARGASEAPWDRVFCDSGSFIITPTKGALVPGWLLVVAKRHVLCSGAISVSELPELADCVRTAQQMVRDNFGEPTVFEHGPSEAGTSLGCGIDHLHLHVAPLSFSLRKATNKLFHEVKWESVMGLSSTSALFESRVDYGFVQEPNGRMFICSPPRGTKQFFRRAIASEIGIPAEYDYSKFPHLSNVISTLDKLPHRTP